MSERENAGLGAGFGDGVATGIAGSAILLEGVFATMVSPDLAGAYREFQGTLPWISSMVLSPIWAAATAGALVAVIVNVLRTAAPARSRTIALAVVAAVAIGVLTLTVVGAYWPLWQLSGAIRAE